MIRKICISILFLFPALPVYAGHGTIRETDTEIIVEYYGEDAEKREAKALQEQREKDEVNMEKVAEVKKARSVKLEERRKERHKDDD